MAMTGEFDYYASRSGLSGFRSLPDHKLAFWRNAVGNQMLSIADAEVAYYRQEDGVSGGSLADLRYGYFSTRSGLPAGQSVTDHRNAFFAAAGIGFVALGDSISTTYESGSASGGFGDAWAQMACAFSGQRLGFVGNGGVSGETSAQILARVGTVIALEPQTVTILAGTNDISSAVPQATWQANIQSMVTQLLAAGIRPVLCTIPPRGDTTYLATTNTWNAWLKVYAASLGLAVIDFFTLLAHPGTGIYAAGYDSGDGLHPSQSAHLAMARQAVAQIAPGGSVPNRAAVNDPGNLIVNGRLTSGSPTPASWIVDGSATADWTNGLVVDPDFAGNAWEIAITDAASSGTFRTFTSFQSTGFAPGDELEFVVKVKVLTASGVVPSSVAGFRLQIFFNGAAAPLREPISADGTVHEAALHRLRYIVPAGATDVQVAVVAGVIPALADFTVRVGEFGLFNLTAEAA